MILWCSISRYNARSADDVYRVVHSVIADRSACLIDVYDAYSRETKIGRFHTLRDARAACERYAARCSEP